MSVTNVIICVSQENVSGICLIFIEQKPRVFSLHFSGCSQWCVFHTEFQYFSLIVHTSKTWYFFLTWAVIYRKPLGHTGKVKNTSKESRFHIFSSTAVTALQDPSAVHGFLSGYVLHFIKCWSFHRESLILTLDTWRKDLGSRRQEN